MPSLWLNFIFVSSFSSEADDPSAVEISVCHAVSPENLELYVVSEVCEGIEEIVSVDCELAVLNPVGDSVNFLSFACHFVFLLNSLLINFCDYKIPYVNVYVNRKKR